LQALKYHKELNWFFPLIQARLNVSNNKLATKQGFISSSLVEHRENMLPVQPETLQTQPSCLQVKLLLSSPPGQKLKSFNAGVGLACKIEHII
jgi:hypothetical protein